MNNSIKIVGAKENNLKNVSLEIPRNKFVVFTGVSGSGKSSLAFGTIFAEGQRRYIESLSSYARMFLGQTQKPDVETIEGLSPAISIDQKTTNRNPRSTVGTVTEIYDYLRLLFARVGTPYCPNCHREVKQQSIDQIVDAIKELGIGAKISVLAPAVRGQKGRHEKLFESLKKSGYVRVEVDGNTFTLDEEIKLDKNIKHDINVVVDRIVIKDGKDARLAGSLETALKLGDGLVIIATDEKRDMYSTNYACPTCGWTLEEVSPRLFSFNAPFGACPHCTGLGFTMDIDEGIILKNSNLSINEGAFNITGWRVEEGSMARAYFESLSKAYDIDLDKPVNKLARAKLDILLYGTGDQTIEVNVGTDAGSRKMKVVFEGLVNNLRRRYRETTSEFIKYEIGKFMRQQTCGHCHGKRLNESALAVKINKMDIDDYCGFCVRDLIPTFENLKLDKTKSTIAEPILHEILARLNFLQDVGLGYLTLSRSAETLSGGEAQRIRLAT